MQAQQMNLNALQNHLNMFDYIHNDSRHIVFSNFHITTFKHSKKPYWVEKGLSVKARKQISVAKKGSK